MFSFFFFFLSFIWIQLPGGLGREPSQEDLELLCKAGWAGRQAGENLEMLSNGVFTTIDVYRLGDFLNG